MNCLEFRRWKLADPRRLSPEATAHAGECAHCREFAASIDESEVKFAEVLSVPVPDGLADRVILRRKAGVRLPPRLLALAASVALTLGIGVRWWQDYASRDFARLAIEHVMHEPESFTTTRIADPALLKRVVENFGGELEGPIGRVRFMKLCPVPEGTGWHIVFETEYGLATLILIPDKRMPAEGAQATAGGWNALARRGGQGYYAIITSSPDSLGAVDQLIRQRVRWRG